MNIPILGTHGIPLTTAASGTYGYLVPPMANAWTGILELNFTVGTSAETLSILRPLGLTHLSAAAAAAQKVVNLNADPGVYSAAATKKGLSYAFSTADDPIAAGDYVAYQCPDGTWVFDTVATVATLAITLTTNNVPTGGLPVGTPFYFFGLTTDVNPYDAQVQPSYTLFASETAGALSIGSDAAVGPFVQSYGMNNPLLILATSTTTQSYLQRGSVVYLQRPGPYGNSSVPYPNG